MLSLRRVLPGPGTLALVLVLVPALVPRLPAAAQTSPAPRPSLAQPTLSPDDREIAFVSGGDIWVAPAQGGVARLLVSHEAAESRPLYSPDGRRLAFVSDRAGSDDLYVLELASGALTRVTSSSSGEHLDAWSPDGEWLYFTASGYDVGGLTDVFRVRASGGTPVPAAADRHNPEYFAAASPDGRTLAVSGRARMGFSQWWRNGSSHIDEAEVWLVDLGEVPAYRRLTEPGAKHIWPQWMPDGRAVIYMSDRAGTENLWLHALDGSPRRLTDFADGRVLWPTLGAGGRAVVFERDFGLWRLDLAAGEPRRLEIELRGAAQGPTVEHLTLRDDFEDLALAPDGKKLAFTARGEVFAVGAAEGGDAVRITQTTAAESEPAWAPDSRRLAYVSRRDGSTRVYLYDFATEEERRLTGGSQPEAFAAWSPDGKRIALARDGRELVVVDVETGRERVVARGNLWRAPFTSARPLAWSPDGRWLAYLAADERLFTNVHLASADGAEPARAISRLANSFANSLAWAPDGKALYFDTQHRTEDGRIVRVDLVPRPPEFREAEFDRLFEDEAKGGDKPDSVVVRVEMDGIFERTDVLPLALDVNELSVSKDGETLFFTANAQGQTSVWSYSLDPLADSPRVPKQLTSTPGSKGLPWPAADGKRVYFLDRGRIRSVGADGGDIKSVEAVAELDVDFDAEKLEVFDEGWSYLRDHFYDPEMHGVDWSAVRARYAPQIAGARTREELERLMDLMVGELDASHLGHSEPSGRSASTGRLGVRLDPAAYVRDGVHRVAEVLPLGPADLAGIRAGDVLLAVDGQPLDRAADLDRLLENQVGDRVSVRVAGDVAGKNMRTVQLQPVSGGGEGQLAYRDWVRSRREYVHRVSDGRLGYVHMPDMGWGSLQQLMLDLDAENFARDGVIVDIRGNNGGFVNAYALDVFARRGYMTMEIRGYPTVPARSLLGQRALEAPTALVVDMNSLSDAEDFTEGYRALELGPIIGEPTAGWIIYTWGLQLVDGSSFRMPRSRIRGADGEDMERNPRPVDIRVERPLGESYTGRDAQLERAVQALLQRVPERQEP